jgi:GNAT superfamily N-acetyltransferase
MSRLALHAKPAVLRCARCGKFVDWEEAQLQVVCGCRPRIELPPVMVREASLVEYDAIHELFQRDFGGRAMIAFGEVKHLDDAPALVAEMKGEMAGALAYRLQDGDTLQILALATEPMWQRTGVGSYLVAEAELLARRHHFGRVLFCTTNDNLPALHFYQRRGYRITCVVAGSLVEHARDAKGFAGIPIRDEIRLEKTLD